MRVLRLVWIAVSLWASSAQAAEFPSGDWSWSIDDPETYWAGTVNGSGQMLAQFCYPESGNCVFAVGFSTTCNEGHSYPAMANADSGAIAIKFVCGVKLDDGSNLMLAEDFDQFDEVMRKSTRIGFALPMEGDQFKAIRFSLNGSVQAMDAMRKFAASSSEKRPDVKAAKDTEVF